ALDCACSVSWIRIGSACWLMKTERSVWFGYSGTVTEVILRLTVFRLVARLVVVVFLTTTVTSSGPQRSASAAVPVNDLRAVTTLVFGVAFPAVSAAKAFVPGNASAVAPRTAAVALRMRGSPFVR